MSGAEITTLTWIGDGDDKNIEACRTVNAIELIDVEQGIVMKKTNDMPDGDAWVMKNGQASAIQANMLFLNGQDIIIGAGANTDTDRMYLTIIC